MNTIRRSLLLNPVSRTMVVVGLVLISTLLPGQSAWDAWEETVVRSLHTAEKVTYLSEEAKQVVLFINMARFDGPLFAETFLKTYLEEKQTGRSRYVRSLYRDLEQATGLEPLEPEPDLTAIARDHATSTGEQGRTGHGNFSKRYESLLGNPYQGVAENLAYGHAEAIDIVISLLIDEGIRDLGHRKNMLNPLFNSVGVAISPHRTYRVNCAIGFGARSRSDLNQVPFR